MKLTRAPTLRLRRKRLAAYLQGVRQTLVLRRDVTKAVLFFGAGASYGATREGAALPDQARLLSRLLSVNTPAIKETTAARKLVVQYMRAMYPGPFDQTALPFEEVVGPLEWLESRQSPWHIGGGDMRNVRTLAAFDTLLAVTLNRPKSGNRRVPVYGPNLDEKGRRAYDAFYSVTAESPNAYSVCVSKIAELERPVVVSLNYDLLLDRVLLHHTSGVIVDYHIPHHPLAEYFTEDRETCVSLIKPHGSINWLWCTRCHQLTVTGTKMVFSGSQCGRCSHSTPWPDGTSRALLLRPSFFKPRDVAATIWEQLIRLGRQFLAEAPTWIFVGYSFPFADVWVRGWLREACLLKGGPPDRVVVVDPADAGPDRFRAFFGSDVVTHRRETFWDFAQGLSGADLR